MDGGGVAGFKEVSLPLQLHYPIQESCPTQRARGRLDSHRQIGFFRDFGLPPFRERVSSIVCWQTYDNRLYLYQQKTSRPVLVQTGLEKFLPALQTARSKPSGRCSHIFINNV
jgi:hypothetical protein